MSDSLPAPAPYQVICSEVVRRELLACSNKAQDRGIGPEYLAGLQDFYRRLMIYPQFGDPLSDLLLKPSQLMIGSVWPLVLRYTLDEERRLVMVVAAFVLLPRHTG